MTYFRPYWFSFPNHIEGRICERILRIFWTYLTDNESVSILQRIELKSNAERVVFTKKRKQHAEEDGNAEYTYQFFRITIATELNLLHFFVLWLNFMFLFFGAVHIRKFEILWVSKSLYTIDLSCLNRFISIIRNKLKCSTL